MFTTRTVKTLRGERKLCGQFTEAQVWEGSIADLGEHCTGPARDLLQGGSARNSAKIEELRKLASGIDAPQPAYQTRPGIVGGSGIVGRALMGHPVSMRKRTRVSAPLAPVTFWLNLSCAGRIQLDLITRYRVLLASLACTVAKVRPTRLRAFTGLGNSGMVIDIPLAPMDSTGLAGIVDANTYNGDGGIIDRFMSTGRERAGCPWFETGAGAVKVLGGNPDTDIVTPRLSCESMVPKSDKAAMALIEGWAQTVLAGGDPWKTGQ